MATHSSALLHMANPINLQPSQRMDAAIVIIHQSAKPDNVLALDVQNIIETKFNLFSMSMITQASAMSYIADPTNLQASHRIWLL